MNQVLQILTVVNMAHDVRAECRLKWNVYDISVYCKFSIKCMQKMNVITEISCYL